MKKTMKPVLLLATFFFAIATNSLHAQSSMQSPYLGQSIVANPNAQKDIKLVSDYVNAVINGDADNSRNFLATDYKGYGPSPADSATVEQSISNWKENYTRQSDRKVDFATTTFKVTEGQNKGELFH